MRLRYTGDNEEYGGMVIVVWLFVLMWAIFGILVAFLYAGNVDGIAGRLLFLQGYFCYVWISVVMSFVLALATDHREK